jgi:hypothetical protein
VKSSIRKENSQNKIALDNAIGNEPLLVVAEHSILLADKYIYQMLPRGIFDLVLSSGTRALEKNACDVGDGSEGVQAPLRENVS